VKFEEKVWKLLKKIPKGKVTTYGLVARKLNSMAYRAVGTACHNNPHPIITPCHRVVRSDGTVAVCRNDRCHKKRIRLLEKEGINFRKNKIIDFKKVLFRF